MLLWSFFVALFDVLRSLFLGILLPEVQVYSVQNLRVFPLPLFIGNSFPPEPASVKAGFLRILLFSTLLEGEGLSLVDFFQLRRCFFVIPPVFSRFLRACAPEFKAVLVESFFTLLPVTALLSFNLFFSSNPISSNRRARITLVLLRRLPLFRLRPPEP